MYILYISQEEKIEEIMSFLVSHRESTASLSVLRRVGSPLLLHNDDFRDPEVLKNHLSAMPAEELEACYYLIK